MKNEVIDVVCADWRRIIRGKCLRRGERDLIGPEATDFVLIGGLKIGEALQNVTEVMADCIE